MPGFLRDYLQFPAMEQQQPVQSEDDLAKLIQQMQGMSMEHPPQMRMPHRMPMPERQQQSLADILPQLLAGAGDVFKAGARQNSNYLGGVMGQQRGMRDQNYNDQLNQGMLNYQNDMGDRQAAMQDYQMRQGAQGQMFNRDQKLAELLMMQKALGEQGQKQQAQRDIFQQAANAQLGEATDINSLEKERVKLLKETQGDQGNMAALTHLMQLHTQRIALAQRPGPIQKQAENAFRGSSPLEMLPGMGPMFRAGRQLNEFDWSGQGQEGYNWLMELLGSGAPQGPQPPQARQSWMDPYGTQRR